MKENIKTLTFLNLLFLTILLLSGAFGGVLGKTVYYLAFVLPITMGIYFIAKQRKTQHGSDDSLKFSIKKQEFIFALPLFAPTLILIILVSLGLNALMSAFGIESTASYSDPFWLAVIIHALIPSIAEELLFRYIPIELLQGAKHGTVIILSSIFFAFAHASLFSIPYALIAGIVFAATDIKAKSILPSFMLHLLNNILSLSLMYGAYTLRLAIFIVLGAASIAGVTVMFVKRKAYAESAKALFTFSKEELTPYPILFVLASLFIAITNIIFS